jgi:hypothetical protein
MKKVLLVSYGGGHIKMLLPIARKLRELGVEVVFFAFTTAIETVSATEFSYFTYKDFFKSAAVKKHGQRLMNELNVSKVDDEESVAYLGQNYVELICKYGAEGAKEVYQKSGRQAFDPRNSMVTVLREINPDLVISTNSPRSEKCIIQAAGSLGISSVALIDMFAIRCRDWFKSNDFASRVCVFSQHVKQFLVENGRNEEDVIVTGNPVFDDLMQMDVPDRKHEPYRVLWASQREPEYFSELGVVGDPQLPEKIESKLIEIFKRRGSEWQLVVRNHPNEEARSYPSFVVNQTSSKNLSEVLLGVDLVLTCTSTVGFEGTLLGRELITIDASVFTPTIPFSEYGFSTGITDLDALENALEQAYGNRFITKPKHYDILSATDNVVNVVRQLLR